MIWIVCGGQSLSSSVHGTLDKNGHLDIASRSPKLIEGFLKSGPKKNLFRTCFDKEKKYSASPKPKMSEQPPKTSQKPVTNQESKQASISPKDQPSYRKNRKSENPIRFPPAKEKSPNLGHSSSGICKNSACRAVLSICDSFCKRCSCCICHLFDENKDPSLWLVCTSEYDGGDSCGLSCHIECALHNKKAGVVDLGQFMNLDGSSCCVSCGKVTVILGCWKKQLSIAKEARRVDILCQRILLSYRLLDGTSRFKELHEIVRDAKAKLEAEVGPLDGISAKMGRSIVGRLPVAGDLQTLCSLAIDKADEWLATVSNKKPSSTEGSVPAACRFLFEEVTSSSVVIVLTEPSTSSSNDIKGYKLWYCMSRGETHPKEPICIFPRDQRKILISNLQPCTEYSFEIVSYTDVGDLGHSEGKCFTKSVEIIHKDPNSATMNNNKDIEGNMVSALVGSASEFMVRDLGNVLSLAWALEQGCSEGFCGVGIDTDMDREKRGEIGDVVEAESPEKVELPAVSRGLDLNVAPLESSRNEDNGCILGQAFEGDDDAVSHDIVQNAPVKRGPTGEVPPVGPEVAEPGRKRAASTNLEMREYGRTRANRISDGFGCLDENYEYCVKMIRVLECGGHIKEEFRLKFLTWFSMRSIEQERRVVNTFIRTLVDDPVSLAAQLVDSFSEIVYSKKPRIGFFN